MCCLFSVHISDNLYKDMMKFKWDNIFGKVSRQVQLITIFNSMPSICATFSLKSMSRRRDTKTIYKSDVE